MGEEKVTDNRDMKNIGPIEAYDILLRRLTSEDRIIVERTSMFLAASSFLFLAFVMLLDPTLAPIVKALRIVLSIVGLFLTFVLYCLNLMALNALGFWHVAQRKIEETAPEFAYMRENEITTHIHASNVIGGKKRWERNDEGKWLLHPVKGARRLLNKPLQWVKFHHIYWLYLPGIFCMLWLASLIIAIYLLLP